MTEDELVPAVLELAEAGLPGARPEGAGVVG
jgi:hypothetical protein